MEANTEIVDYSMETFSFHDPCLSDSMLSSMHLREPSFITSSEGVTNSSFESRPSLSSQGMEYPNYMGTAQGAHGMQHFRPFQRSHSQPLQPVWKRRMINSSSAESSQSDTHPSQLQLAREKINELSRENMALSSRLDKLEGLFNAVMSGSQVPHHSFSPGYFTIPSRPPSPFPGSLSMASSPFVAGSSLAPSADIFPKREDYPKVKFWYRQDWSKFLKDSGNSTDIGMDPVRGKTLMSKGINKNAKYVEGADRVPIDGYKLRDIRSHARAVWESLRTIGRAPPSWGKADAEVAQCYHHEMRTKFPQFALCENDWKADLLATDHYPSWYSNRLKSGIEVKEEDMVGPVPSGLKRPFAFETTTAALKKVKKDGQNPKKLDNVSKFSDESSILPIMAEETVFPVATRPMNDNVSSSKSTLVQTKVVPKVRNPLLDKLSKGSPLPFGLNNAMNAMDTTDMVTTTATAKVAADTTATATVAVNTTATVTADTPATVTVDTTAAVAGDTVVADTTTVVADATATVAGNMMATVATMAADATAMVTTTTMDTMAITTATETTAERPAAEGVCSDSQKHASLTHISLSVIPSMSRLVNNPLVDENQRDPVPVSTLLFDPALVPSNVVEPVSVAISQKVSQTRKNNKMQPNASVTARNLCAQDWCAAHPDGTKAEFQHYYDHISTDLKKMYEQCSKEAKAKAKG